MCQFYLLILLFSCGMLSTSGGDIPWDELIEYGCLEDHNSLTLYLEGLSGGDGKEMLLMKAYIDTYDVDDELFSWVYTAYKIIEGHPEVRTNYAHARRKLCRGIDRQ
jgi:hypothetical protein